jgi:uncharacterized protein (TIGR02246 family)
VSADRDEILDLVATYAQAVDDRDIERILTVFTPDARLDFVGGAISAAGHDGIRDAFEQAFRRPEMAAPATSTHLMANTLVTIDGNTAHAETQAVAYHASRATGTVVTRGLRYRDVLRRVDDRWLIAHRVHRSLWQTEAPGTSH